MKAHYILTVLLLLCPFLVQAAEPKAAVKPPVVSLAPEKDTNAIVVELFTSQGCSSCPPAQEYLLQLSRRPDVLTLEYHVDYWDALKTWTGGSWKDPFSSSEWTERQVAYNNLLMEEEGRAFTPEMVIDGRFQSTGTAKSSVGSYVDEARAHRRQKYTLTPAVGYDGAMTVSVEGPRLKDPAEVVLLRLVKEASTHIKGGENKGETMRGHNIVQELMVIGTWDGGKESYKFALPKFEMGKETCAVLLQDPETKHIYAGGLCLM